MAFLEWSDEYKVNIRVIDNEHRALFAMVNALHEAVQKGTAEAAIAATLDAFMMHRLGYGDIAVYDASMSEWAKDESLPIETG